MKKNGQYKKIIPEIYIIVKLIISCIIISGLIGCSNPVIEIPEIIPEPIIEEDIQDIEDIEIIEEEPEIIIIEEIEEMELKSIKEYDHYFVTEGGPIFGIDNGAELIIIEDTDDKVYFLESFEIKDSVIMIVISTIEQGDPIPDTDPVQYEQLTKYHYFNQKDGVMKSVDKSKCPPQPAPVTIELDDPPFKIISGQYQKTDISEVYQNTAKIAYLPVTGAFVTESGLWYNVSETFATREAGLYFWEINGNPRKILEKGRFW